MNSTEKDATLIACTIRDATVETLRTMADDLVSARVVVGPMWLTSLKEEIATLDSGQPAAHMAYLVDLTAQIDHLIDQAEQSADGAVCGHEVKELADHLATGNATTRAIVGGQGMS